MPAAKDSGSGSGVTTRAKSKDKDELPPSNHVREHTGTKRTRETSLEPTPNPISTPLVTKKNRLASTTELDPSPEQDASPDQDVDVDVDQSPEQKGNLPSRDLSSTSKKEETNNVGEVRRKVQEMTWKEGQPVPVPTSSSPVIGGKEGAASPAKAGIEDKDRDDEVKVDDEGGKDLKRKSLNRNESSILEPLSPKRAKETPSPPPEAEKPAPAVVPAPAPVAKKQSTFSAFSSSASPFASTSSASPFASSSKPLSTGSAFGNYSSTSSPFARKSTSAFGSTETAPVDKEEKVESTIEKKESGNSFGDILKESKADDGDSDEKVQMTEKDVHTGEEGEETVYQCRAKLYVMQSDGGWKERGVGALKLNVKSADGKSPRLVMRAEGVLRLMLNVSLYVGMTLIEDGKHVRSTVFEDGERRLVTFRLGSQKAASELMGYIQDHIPLESDTKSPTPGTATDAKSTSTDEKAGGW